MCSKTLGGPWTRNSEKLQTNCILGVNLGWGPMDPQRPRTLYTRLLHPWIRSLYENLFQVSRNQVVIGRHEYNLDLATYVAKNTPAYYRFRSDCSYSLVPASAGGFPLLPPPFFSCARNRRALRQLALNVHVKHSDLTCTWQKDITLNIRHPRATNVSEYKTCINFISC